MLAKAYSIVRGSREKEDAPLDEFFKLCTPLIGVIQPEVSCLGPQIIFTMS